MAKVTCLDLVPKKHPIWTKEKDTLLIELNSIGLDFDIIALELGPIGRGRKRDMIRKRLRELGKLPGMLAPNEPRKGGRPPQGKKVVQAAKAASQPANTF